MSHRSARLRRALGRAAWTLSSKATQDPFGLFMAFFVLVSGATLLYNSPQDSGLNALLPHWLLVAWAAALTLGGGLMLLGMFRKGYVLEVAGLTLLAWTCPVYSLIVFYAVGTRAIFSILVTLAFAAACAWRAHIITSTLRKLRRVEP